MLTKPKTASVRISKTTGKPVRPYTRRVSAAPTGTATTETRLAIPSKSPLAALVEATASTDKVIVSGNYRDRNSPYRWIVRKASDSLDKGVAVRRVICQNKVVFRDSDGESGFGCNIVAVTTGVIVEGVLPEENSRWSPKYDCTAPVPEPRVSGIAIDSIPEIFAIRFNGSYMVDSGGDPVQGTGGLVLDERGKIYGVPVKVNGMGRMTNAVQAASRGETKRLSVG